MPLPLDGDALDVISSQRSIEGDKVPFQQT
jgi:hypothetical protein